MGTLSYTVGAYATDDNKNIMGAGVKASGSAATTTTAANLAGLTLERGDVIMLHASEPMWINFGGTAAAVGTGHFIAENAYRPFEISQFETGAVSAIDVS